MDNMEMLIHASFSEVKKFIPRVPTGRAPGEDGKTPHICFCTKLENAISSMPGGGFALNGLFKLKSKVAPVLHVYICFTWENMGVQFLPPYKVQFKHNVPDAVLCGEWWALETPTLLHKLIKVKEAEYEEALDLNGEKALWVKHIRYDVVHSLPVNAPEIFFSKHIKDYSTREILSYIGERE